MRNFIRKWTKEIVIAFILAVIAAIIIDPLKIIRERLMLNSSSGAVARISVYDKDHKSLGWGSGFFINGDCGAKEGTLVTNYHVVEGADLTSIEAKLPNGAYYKIKDVIGGDKYSDIAILLFDAKGIPSISLGNSDTVQSGEKIRTIGWPLALDNSGNSVTDGVISNPKREFNNQDYIQFTAPISSGNSGGVLIDDSDKVVGITSSSVQIPPGEGNAENVNFAVPINKVCDAIKGNLDVFTKNSPLYYYSLAIAAENNKNFDDAINFYKQAISTDDTYVEAYLGLGGVYYEKGQYDLELQTFKQAVQKDPSDADALWDLASAYEDVGQFDEALLNYQAALKAKPENTDALYSLGILYVVLGQKDKAVNIASQLIKLDPGLGKEIQLLSK